MTARIVAHITALLALFLLAATAWSADAPNVTLDNEFVRVVVNRGPDEAGRFSIRTTGGDPSRPTSKNQHLIFGGNAPWTSYTTVKVDGTNFAFGGPTHRRAGQVAKYGTEVTSPSPGNNNITCAYQYGDVQVTQELGFVRGLGTRMLDTVGITYRITNKGGDNHQVGLRVLLDTMCGKNDGAPIRAAGSQQAITTAVGLAGKDAPEYWQAFDSLADPSVISQGTLRGGDTTPPDKVLFADWGTLADDPWDPGFAPNQGFVRKGEADVDTATALLWNPVTVEPGQTITYVTYYGIGGYTGKAGILTLGLAAPAETTFEHERTQEFTIMGYLQNTGGFEARDVTLALTLPEGLTLVSGSKAKSTFPSLKPDETVQASWTVIPNGKAGGQKKLTLSVSSTNIEANEVQREIQVNVPKPRLQVTPPAQMVPLETNARSTIIPIQMNLVPAEEFYGVRFTLKYDPNVVRPLGEPFGVLRGRAFAENGRLLTWTFDDTVDGTIVVTGRRTDGKTTFAPLTQAEINLATVKFRTVAAGKTALTLENAVLINAKNEEVPVDISTGEIEVVADPAALP